MAQDVGNWVDRLSSTGAEQESAVAQLRDILLRGVTAASRNRYGGNIQVDDVVQEALLTILDKLHTFEGRSKFTTWAMTIAMRKAISELRKKHHKDISMSTLLNGSMSFEPEVSSQGVAEETERYRALAILRDLIDTKLTSKQRDAMHALLNNVPVEVYAQQTGSNRNAVYKLTHDARIKLREGFEEAGFEAIDTIL